MVALAHRPSAERPRACPVISPRLGLLPYSSPLRTISGRALICTSVKSDSSRLCKPLVRLTNKDRRFATPLLNPNALGRLQSKLVSALGRARARNDYLAEVLHTYHLVEPSPVHRLTLCRPTNTTSLHEDWRWDQILRATILRVTPALRRLVTDSLSSFNTTTTKVQRMSGLASSQGS